MTIPTYAAGLTAEDIQIINSDVDKTWSLAYANTPVVSDVFCNVRPSGANTITLAALTQIALMSKWIGGKREKTVNMQAVTLKSADYETTVGIDRADFMSDRTGIYGDLAFRLGSIGKKHQDYEAKKILQCGYPATQAAKYPQEPVTLSALTGDTLFSNTHALDPNNSGGVVWGGGTTSVGQQTNMISGSAITSGLVATAFETMCGFTGDQGQVFDINPRFIVHPPQQHTPVMNAIQAQFNPFVAANSALATSLNVAAANEPASNVVTGYGLEPILFPELRDDPNVVYLVGEMPGLKALRYAQFIAPHVIPSVTPQNWSVFYQRRFEWSVEDNVLMVAPLWPFVIRISVQGS